MASFEKPKTAAELGLMAVPGFPPAADMLVTHANQLFGPYNRWSFQNELPLNPTIDVWRGPAPEAALESEPADLSQVTYKNRAGTQFSFDDMVEMSCTDGILVLHRGKVIYERYLNGMQAHSLHCWASGSKSVTGVLAAALAHEGLFDPGGRVSFYLPELKDSGFGDATLRQVMDMTTAVGFAEEQADQVTENYDYGIAMGWLEKPSGYQGPANAYEQLPTMFAFVAAFGAVLGLGYAVAIGETHSGERTPLTLAPVLRGYGSLLRDRRFVVPAASVALVLGGLFAVFTVTPAILVDGLGFSPLELSLFYAGTVFVVFGAGFAAPRLAQRSSLAAVTRLGLNIASSGCVLMAALAVSGFHTFASYLLPMLVFLFGMGMLNPIGTALTLTPFGERAGAASALLGFMQMAAASLAIITATTMAASPFLALSIVLAATTTAAALVFCLRA